jgi:class 3 adenylate cyclase
MNDPLLRQPVRVSSGVHPMATEPRSPPQIIDEALELARQRSDVYAARARALFVTVIALLAVVLRLFGAVRVGIYPPIWIATFLAYAYGVLWYVGRGRRRGPSFPLVTHTIDLLITASYGFVIMTAVPQYLSAEEAHRYIIYIVPVAMTSSVAIAAERGSAKVSLYLGVLACALVTFVLIYFDGPRMPQWYVALMLMITGLSGLAVGRRSRSMLEMMERLKRLKAFVPEEVHERVVTDSSNAFAIGGATHTLTILVLDLRGFTSLAEKLPPDEVVAELNAFHAAMLEVVIVHGGKLDKFIGDGAQVVFGLDQASGRTTSRSDFGAHAAVSCARGMLRALGELNEDRGARTQAPLEMGIGIHTGRVVAGNIGVPEVRLEWTVIGDAVNTAARIQGACRELGVQVIVSAETVSHLPDTSGLSPLPPLTLKGKEAKVPVFSLGSRNP